MTAYLAKATKCGHSNVSREQTVQKLPSFTNLSKCFALPFASHFCICPCQHIFSSHFPFHATLILLLWHWCRSRRRTGFIEVCTDISSAPARKLWRRHRTGFVVHNAQFAVSIVSSSYAESVVVVFSVRVLLVLVSC
jgi:hypothetical protein